MSASQEESSLRQELSAHISKLSVLEAQNKSQSRLLAEKQKDMQTLVRVPSVYSVYSDRVLQFYQFLETI